MFKGRKKELELLEDLYDSKQFEFLVLYGVMPNRNLD